jgi:hypothetical protein
LIEKPIEFMVVGFVEGQNVTLIGRCGDEPIARGDEFNAIYRLKPRRYPEESGDLPVRMEEHLVSLRVVAIQAYGRSFDILGQGSTGSITVEGDGSDRIATGWIVGRRIAVPALPGEPSRTANDPAIASTVPVAQTH